jgi:hypothetical protein
MLYNRDSIKQPLERGVLNMGLMFSTVIGYTVCLGLVGGFIMHYLAKALPTADSVRIDPKPENKF